MVLLAPDGIAGRQIAPRVGLSQQAVCKRRQRFLGSGIRGLDDAPRSGRHFVYGPTHRRKLGWRWSILTDTAGIPIGWVIDGADHNHLILLVPTLHGARDRGLLCDIETIRLDRGHDSGVIRARLVEWPLTDAVIAKRGERGDVAPKKNHSMALRWPIEHLTSWLSNFGQLWRKTDRQPVHRLSPFALAVVRLLTTNLIAWRNRWSTTPTPIR